ncbi:hypothetical protein [Kitasatospora purpeofusca]|uniref:hypothetical protein n=1 Tax=Kitasatospora purpeofusca TaxID=67352 RepID=UPI0036D22904
MPSNGEIEDAQQEKKAGLYNALIQGLQLDPDRFQLISPATPVGDTSDKIWEFFDNIPPRTLAYHFDEAGGNRFYDNYAEVINRLQPPSDDAFEEALGDYIDEWKKYLKKQKPAPTLEQLPGVFRDWAAANHPDIAEAGAQALEQLVNDPLLKAQEQVRDKSHFIKNTPDFSSTIENLKDGIRRAQGAAVSFDSATADIDVRKTWASGEFGVFYFVFGGGGGSWSKISETFASSRVTVECTFDHVMTLQGSPGNWYNSAALSRAYSTEDNTVWKPGKPSWNSTFGPKGDMQRFCTALIVADGIKCTVTSDASYSQKDQERFKSDGDIGIWPFFFGNVEGGSSTETTFTSEGHLKAVSTSPGGNPLIIGCNVTQVKDFLG